MMTALLVPIHTLPHDELLAVLQAQTSVQLVEDPRSDTGRKIEDGSFTGWAESLVW